MQLIISYVHFDIYLIGAKKKRPIAGLISDLNKYSSPADTKRL